MFSDDYSPSLSMARMHEGNLECDEGEVRGGKGRGPSNLIENDRENGLRVRFSVNVRVTFIIASVFLFRRGV